MGDKIVVGPINKGLRNDVTAFVIDNDSFPTLINAYQWRAKVKRKRGTSLLARLSRFFDSTNISYNSGSTSITLDATGTGNLLTGFLLNILSPNASLVPGSITIIDSTGPQTYTDNSLGVLTGSLGGSGTINYNSGSFTIVGGAAHTVTAKFIYYPVLPVMGLEEIALTSTQYPGTVAFDTKYAYDIRSASPYGVHDISFYKNPASGTPPGYVQKTNATPITWNGFDYQQFWTVNYEGAFWATNGISSDFAIKNVGMQFSGAADITYNGASPATPTTITLDIANCPLVIGDFVFLNEFTGANSKTLNFLSGFVTACAPNTPALALKTVTITFPGAAIGAGPYSPGMVQYLTTRRSPTLDGIRWYDGDPTDGIIANPTLVPGNGWVNFAPPLSKAVFSIDNNIEKQYYLVGARIILPFKNRLLFFGPVIQASSEGSQIYLQDAVIYSQNGTPYYTATFAADPSLADTVFTPILVPSTGPWTATVTAYWEDQTGFGGNQVLGVESPITVVAPNKDVLLIGLDSRQASLIYTGDDIIPFNFYTTNSELGSSSTFSYVIMNEGTISRGNRGFILATQNGAERIDLEIPDEVFQIRLTDNGTERICSQRDYVKEWIQFTYPVNSIDYKFPTQTMQYNYRDKSWAIFYESYTTYGSFRKQTGFTWSTVGFTYHTWAEWNVPWNSGSSTLLQPEVIGGNQQGFVLIKEDATGEGHSLSIHNISVSSTITGITTGLTTVIATVNGFVPGQTVTITGVVGTTELNGNTYTILFATPTTITINAVTVNPYFSGGTVIPPVFIYSPDHTLSNGDYILITGALGTIGPLINGKVFSVQSPTTTGFFLNPAVGTGAETYLGEGLIKRMYVPYIQTKQFPVAWNMARKTRLGPQQYLLSKTPNAEIQLLIFLSQNARSAYNDGPIVPENQSDNNSLIYSTVLSTSPQYPVNNVYSVSIGNVGDSILTTINLNLLTLLNINNEIVASVLEPTVLITIGSLATFQDNGIGGFTVTGTGVVAGSSINYVTGAVVLVFSVAPASTASNVSLQYYAINIQTPTAINQDQIWHRINTSLIGDTVQVGFTMSDAQMRDPTLSNQFEEIELHGFILDVSPSQQLV